MLYWESGGPKKSEIVDPALALLDNTNQVTAQPSDFTNLKVPEDPSSTSKRGL